MEEEEQTLFTPDSKKKIFISHSSNDKEIASKLLDALIEMGIDKDIFFYSSRSETGIEIGNQIPDKLYENLHNTEVVIFILTDNFYKSSVCMNEMGAAWILDKDLIPVLLGGLTPDNMKGVVDKKYIAFDVEKDDVSTLEKKLSRYITKKNTLKTTKEIFSDFLVSTKKIMKIEDNDTQGPSSNIEKQILAHRFTDDEIILLNLFIELNSNKIEDGYENNGPDEPCPRKDEVKQKNYISQFIDFDIKKAKQMLIESEIIYEQYDSSDVGNSRSEPEYIGYEVKIDLFRDLFNLTAKAKSEMTSILTKHKNTKVTEKKEMNKVDEIILSADIADEELLLIKYMKDKMIKNIGAGWKSDGQISDIKKWEGNNGLNDNLSSKYDVALRWLEYHKLIEASEFTSYGNPREYALYPEYDKMMVNISEASKQKLRQVEDKNKIEIPF